MRVKAYPVENSFGLSLIATPATEASRFLARETKSAPLPLALLTFASPLTLASSGSASAATVLDLRAFFAGGSSPSEARAADLGFGPGFFLGSPFFFSFGPSDSRASGSAAGSAGGSAAFFPRLEGGLGSASALDDLATFLVEDEV